MDNDDTFRCKQNISALPVDRLTVGIDQDVIARLDHFGLHHSIIADIFGHAIEGMMMTDDEGRILVVNPAFSAITGFSRKEVVGRSCRQFRSDMVDDGAFPEFWEELLDNGSWQGQVRCRRKNGPALLDWQSYTVIPDSGGGAPHILSVLGGASAQLHHLEAQLGLLANHDALTGLPNRMRFFERLKQSVHNADSGRSSVAVLFLDIDQFKLINNSLSHEAGDRVLVIIARRLNGSIGRAGAVARMGGDEFAIILTDIGNRPELTGIAENLLAQLLEPVHIDGHTIHVTASIGISVFPHGGGNARSLAQNAETAMYRIKERGRNGFDFFDPSVKNIAVARLDLQSNLRRATESQEFVLNYQPKVALSDRSVLGCEALIRWRHPSVGMISPAEFIPLAEETGLILPIGLWALRAACEQGRRWSRDSIDGLKVAVNLSARQFRQINLIEQVRDVLADTGMPADQLEIELTESTVMDDAEQAIRVMRRLRDMGVWISVDDFGTGYSSLSYLKKARRCDSWVRTRVEVAACP